MPYCSFPKIVCVPNFCFRIVGIALRSHRNTSRASAPTSAFAGKGAARTRPRAHKARAEREEAHHGHQKECQGGTTCTLFIYLPPIYSLPGSVLLKDVRFFSAQNACKVMAKDLVRTRRYVQKFYQMRTQLQAVGLRIQTLRSNQQMADAMRGATRVRPFSLSSSQPTSNPPSLMLMLMLASHSRTYLCHGRWL